METPAPRKNRPGLTHAYALAASFAASKAAGMCPASTTTCYLAADESGTFLVLVCAPQDITEIVQEAMDRLDDTLTKRHLKQPTVPRNSSSSSPNE